MNSVESQHNYFFVIEGIDERHPGISELYAEGNGIEVVEALSRMSILAAGSESIDFRAYTALGLMRRLAYQKFPRLEDTLNTQELALVMGDRLATHDRHDRMISQVNEGVRSPQSVVEEYQQEINDSQLLLRNNRNWFDVYGRRVVSPSRREQGYQNENDEHLVLQLISPKTREEFVQQTTNTALHADLPQGATVQMAEVMPLAVDPHISRSRKRKKLTDAYLTEEGPIVHSTFGYLQDGHFEPFVTELSPHHPVVLKQVAKTKRQTARPLHVAA